MIEADPRAKLVATLKQRLPGAVVLRHEDRYRAGIPDISVTWYGKTTWVEVKLADPDIRGRGIQDVTCLQLEGAGRCLYVIYFEKGQVKRTIIARPRDVHADEWLGAPSWATGFDHHFVAEFIRGQHRP